MLTDDQVAGLKERCEVAFAKVGEGLSFRTVKTEFNLHMKDPEVIPVYNVNGHPVEAGDERGLIRIEDIESVVGAAILCGQAKAEALKRGQAKWPDQPLVWAENWGLSLHHAERKEDGVIVCFVDVRGYVLPAIMLEAMGEAWKA